MNDPISTVIMIGLASSVLSITITKNAIGAPLRRWAKARNQTLGKLFKCYFCLSHWIALAFAVLCPRLGWSEWLLVDVILTTLGAVGIATLISAAILALIIFSETPPSE